MNCKKALALHLTATFIYWAFIPFKVIAYPHILVCRLVKRLSFAAARAEFISRGMCGGCGKFGTKACRRHCKNPYAIMPNQDCYSTH